MVKLFVSLMVMIFCMGCASQNIKSAATLASDIDIETTSTDFTPASTESQARAKTQAKYIGATSNSGTAQIHECLFNQIGGKCTCRN